MARQLNKSRLLYTKLGIALTVFCILFANPIIDAEGAFHESMDMLGSICVAVCVIGRIYCTAFIGGRKNDALVTNGPFSMSRNPLYLFSFIGTCGIGLMSGYMTLLVLLPLLFCFVYFPLIAREEAYLSGIFGDSYAQYCASTPKFFPRLGHYQTAESIMVNVRFVHYAIRDSILWLCALPLFELVERLHEAGVVRTFFALL